LYRGHHHWANHKGIFASLYEYPWLKVAGSEVVEQQRKESGTRRSASVI
jgi:hypothetical protein